MVDCRYVEYWFLDIVYLGFYFGDVVKRIWLLVKDGWCGELVEGIEWWNNLIIDFEIFSLWVDGFTGECDFFCF